MHRLITESTETRWLAGWPAVAFALTLAQLVASYFLSGSHVVAAGSQISYLLLVLLAGAFSIWNAASSKHARIFWMFLSAAFFCWATAQSMFLYHVLARPSEAVDITAMTLPLFLRVVLILAALTVRPDLKHIGGSGFRTTLDFLLILIVWVFLYAYVQFPNRHTMVEMRVYSTLYMAENIALAIALVVLCFRASGRWKVIYGNLLASSVTYMAATISLRKA